MKFLKRILIILILCVPCFVKADMSAPTIIPTKIIVTNPDGVDYYDYQNNLLGHLNKDDIVYLFMDYKNYEIGKIEKNEYGNDSRRFIGIVKNLDSFAIVDKDEVNPVTSKDDSIQKLNKTAKAKVYAENGVDILTGPAKIYKKIGHIDKGTIVPYDYQLRSESGVVYIYVDYNGKKGWLNVLEKNVLLENTTQYIFKEDVETECGIIPKNTIQTPNFETDRWSHETEFEYKGCRTLLYSFRSDSILNIYAFDRQVGRELQIHKTSDSNSEVIGTIPANTDFTSLAGFDIQAGTDNIGYVYYEGITGWVFASWEEFIKEKNNESKVQIVDNVKVTKEIPKIKKTDKKETKASTKKESKILNLDKNEFVIVCVGAGVLLSLTAVVIIILVNKKNKKNKNDVSNAEKLNENNSEVLINNESIEENNNNIEE